VGVAFIGFSFGFLAPGAQAGVYLHGFPPDQFAAIEVRAQRSPSRPGAFTPSVDVDARAVGEATDGTLAHSIVVTNRSTSNGALPAPVVTVAVFLEPLRS
jgi:hypothetical protein